MAFRPMWALLVGATTSGAPSGAQQCADAPMEPPPLLPDPPPAAATSSGSESESGPSTRGSWRRVFVATALS